MGDHPLHHYVREPAELHVTKLQKVDINVLDQLLKDNRRIDALRTIMDDLAAHRTRLRAGDDPGDEEDIALSRIIGILAPDWSG